MSTPIPSIIKSGEPVVSSHDRRIKGSHAVQQSILEKRQQQLARGLGLTAFGG
jgi:hypothetical protein